VTASDTAKLITVELVTAELVTAKLVTAELMNPGAARRSILYPRPSSLRALKTRQGSAVRGQAC
jgi:hypothetical protein